MFKSFTVKYPVVLDEHGKPKKPGKWNAYTLIPQVSEFGEEADGYQYKMICREIANGSYIEYKLLYEETRESEVYEFYGMYLASIYPTT